MKVHCVYGVFMLLYRRTSDKGPSELRTTSLQGTINMIPMCPLFGGSTVVPLWVQFK